MIVAKTRLHGQYQGYHSISGMQLYPYVRTGTSLLSSSHHVLTSRDNTEKGSHRHTSESIGLHFNAGMVVTWLLFSHALSYSGTTSTTIWNGGLTFTKKFKNGRDGSTIKIAMKLHENNVIIRRWNICHGFAIMCTCNESKRACGNDWASSCRACKDYDRVRDGR